MSPKGGKRRNFRLTKHRQASQGQKDKKVPLLIPDYLGRTDPEQAKATEKGIFPPGMTENFQKQLWILNAGLNKRFCPLRTQEGYKHYYEPWEEAKREGWKWKK